MKYFLLCISVLILSILSPLFILCQTDYSMETGSTSIVCGGGSNSQWTDAPGTISYLNNGNFNAVNLGSQCSCTGYATTFVMTPSNPNPEVEVAPYMEWSPNGASSFAMSYASSTLWSTGTRYYCDVLQAFPSISSGFGFYKGMIRSSFLAQHDDTLYCKYMLFELNAPLDQGLDFTFSINMIGSYSNSNPNSVATDQIGFAFVDNLPNYELSYGSFLGDMITPDYVTPVGDFMFNNTVPVTFNITGAGQKYLLIGMFNDPSTLNFTGTFDNDASTIHLMDNAKLYRTDCPNAHVHFNNIEMSNCVNSEAAIVATGGFEPFEWTIDGIVQPETSNTLTMITG